MKTQELYEVENISSEVLLTKRASKSIQEKTILKFYMLLDIEIGIQFKKRNMNLTLVGLALLILGTLSQSCEQSYVANSLSICIQPRYIEGCISYKSETQCKTCGYRYALTSKGLCDLDAQTTQECCQSRAADGSCIKCESGLYLIGGKCEESNILGCLEKNSIGTCINCASGFYLKEGSCVETVKDCVKFSDHERKICTDCAQGFSLYNNICVQNSILGCKNEVDHVCKECYRPFNLNNGHCDIQHCKSYNDYECVACQCGYFLTGKGVCKAMDTGCVRYQRGQCTDCLPNFRLKGNQCEIEGCLDLKSLKCNRCSSEYELIDGACIMKNCQTWKDGSCQICLKGYNLSKGKCIVNQNLSSL